MKTLLLLLAAFAGSAVPALAPLRITSFKSDGQLTWTNSSKYADYRIEWAGNPKGPWNAFGISDLDAIWAQTNRVTVQVPLTNSQCFYRVTWMAPDPIGKWDFRAYDSQGGKVFAGVLVIDRTNTASGYSGWRNFSYVGSPTNNLHWLGRYVGTGAVYVSLYVPYSQVQGSVLPMISDDYNDFSCFVHPASLEGYWSYSTIATTYWGAFEARRQ